VVDGKDGKWWVPLNRLSSVFSSNVKQKKNIVTIAFIVPSDKGYHL